MEVQACNHSSQEGDWGRGVTLEFEPCFSYVVRFWQIGAPWGLLASLPSPICELLSQKWGGEHKDYVDPWPPHGHAHIHAPTHIGTCTCTHKEKKRQNKYRFFEAMSRMGYSYCRNMLNIRIKKIQGIFYFFLICHAIYLWKLPNI